MTKQPTYEELKQRVRELEEQVFELRQAHESLKESEIRYKSLFENMLDGVAVYKVENEGEDFVFTDLNKAGEKISDTNKNIVIGQSVLKMVPGIKESGLFDVFKQVWKTCEPKRHQTALYKDNRVCHWVENSVYKLPSGEIVAVYSDETERKQAEEALQDSEQQFRDLTESTSDWIWEVDREGVYTYSSPKVIELLGYEPEAVIGKTPFDFMPSEEAERVSDIFYAFISSQKPFDNLENTNLHKNGYLVVLETSGVPIFDAKGEFLGYRGIDRDITDRKRIEEALRWELAVNSSLSKLYKPLISRDSTIEDITNTILDEAMLLTGSKHGYVSSVDPNTGDNVGHTLTEMLNGQCTVTESKTSIAFPIGKDSLYSGLWGHALNNREAFIANRPAEHPAARGLPKGHIPIACFLTVPVTLDKELVGQIALANKNEDYAEQDLKAIRRLTEYYALAIQRMRAEEELQKAHDELERGVEERTADLIKTNERLKQEIITRKQAEDALQESGEQYRQLFDTVSDAIMLFDAATKKIIDANSICQSMYGYSKDEFLNLSLSRITAEPEESEQSIKQVLSGEISRIPLRYHRRKDGTIFPVEISSGTFKLGDRRILCGVVRDITERKKIEEALRKKREELSQKAKHLEKVNTALEVLLEHREEEKKKLEENLLINLKKFIFPYIEKLEAGGIDPKNKTYLDIIKRNFNKVIFPFAKSQLPGYLDLTPTEIHVADLIREGKTHKDIALLSNVSPHAVLFHMKNIRKKLGLSHKKINLRAYLQSFTR